MKKNLKLWLSSTQFNSTQDESNMKDDDDDEEDEDEGNVMYNGNAVYFLEPLARHTT